MASCSGSPIFGCVVALVVFRLAGARLEKCCARGIDDYFLRVWLIMYLMINIMMSIGTPNHAMKQVRIGKPPGCMEVSSMMIMMAKMTSNDMMVMSEVLVDFVDVGA